MGNTLEKTTFPTPPKLPSHIKPRICRFGMKCRNESCKFIHIKTKSGRSISALGLANEEIDKLPTDLMSYEGGNLYGLDDSGLARGPPESL